MLLKLSIENFLSIAEKQSIDFLVARNAPELPCFKLIDGEKGTRATSCAGIFGANAAGKSNILRSITATAMFATNSFENESVINNSFQPYRQNKWLSKNTEIEIEFECKLNENEAYSNFTYNIKIDNKHGKTSEKEVFHESLYYSPKGKRRKIFSRNRQKFTFGTCFNIKPKFDPRVASIRPNASVISTLAKLNHPQATCIKNQITSLQTNLLLFRQNLDLETALQIYANDKECLKQLIIELRRVDVGIENMTIEQGPSGLFAKFKHVGLDGFSFITEESQGTISFITIFPRLFYALQSGSIVVIDEVDADFHSLLLPEIFRWFSDAKRNPNNAQLFFNAHNPAILENLEKEQIFFVEKPKGKATQIYGAKNIDVRRDSNLMRKYLSGELGAIPYIG